jgi:serine/threonine-protein kinase
MTGQTVLHYEIRELLGAGGRGLGYRAWDSKLSREVAIKFILLPEEGAAPARVKRFLREAQLASALNHPNIVTIHDIAEWSGSFFLVMELVRGEPLHHRIPPGGLPVDRAIA